MLDESSLKWSGSAVVIGCDSRAVQKPLENDLEKKGFGMARKILFRTYTSDVFEGRNTRGVEKKVARSWHAAPGSRTK